jgi:hypothetical protein
MTTFNEVLERQAAGDFREEAGKLTGAFLEAAESVAFDQGDSRGDLRGKLQTIIDQYAAAMQAKIDELPDSSAGDAADTDVAKRGTTTMQTITKSEIVEKTMQADPSITRNQAEQAAEFYRPQTSEVDATKISKSREDLVEETMRQFPGISREDAEAGSIYFDPGR